MHTRNELVVELIHQQGNNNRHHKLKGHTVASQHLHCNVEPHRVKAEAVETEVPDEALALVEAGPPILDALDAAPLELAAAALVANLVVLEELGSLIHCFVAVYFADCVQLGIVVVPRLLDD